MPLYAYKCSVCHRTVEEFRKVDERERKDTCFAPIVIEKFTCEALGFKEKDVNVPTTCTGLLIFQPMQKTNFTMHHLND